MNHFSKYSFCHRRTTNIPQADEYNLHARPSFQLFAFIITDEPTPSQKNVCEVLERNNTAETSYEIQRQDSCKSLRISL